MQYRFEWQIFLATNKVLCVVKQEFDVHIEARRFAERLRQVCDITSSIRIVEIPEETSVIV